MSAHLGLCVGQRPGATFLLIHPSARATGMAYAYTAIADDAAANYYNSAGLGFSETPSITVSYLGYLTNLWPDAHYFYLGMSYPLANAAWGLDVIFFAPDQAELRDSLGSYLGTELVWRISPRISYGRRVNDQLSLGISWKYIYERFIEGPWWCWLDASGASWAFDFSTLYKPLPFLSVGLALHNIGPDINYTEGYVESRTLPRVGCLGVAYVPWHSMHVKCTISGELTKMLAGMYAGVDNDFWQDLKREFDMARKVIGLELLFLRTISLRGGYVCDDWECLHGFTFGAGIEYKNFRLDVGIDELVYDFNTQNRIISFSYNFN